MELACSVSMFGSARLSESLKKISRVGFRGIELDWETVCRQIPDESRRIVAVKELIKANNFWIAGVFVGSITAEREDQLRLQFRHLVESFEALQEIGAKLAILRGGPRTLENFNCLREGILESLAKDAARCGLELALANEVNSRLENRQDFLGMFTAQFPPNVGVCLDVYHFHLAAVNMGDVIREMDKRVKLIRLADLMGTLSVIPGQGEIEIKGLIRSLRKVGYDGAVVLDHLPGRDGKIDKELEQAYSYLQTVIS